MKKKSGCLNDKASSDKTWDINVRWRILHIEEKLLLLATLGASWLPHIDVCCPLRNPACNLHDGGCASRVKC